MARKGSSGMSGGYAQYGTVHASEIGLGYGTGGATDQWESALDDAEYQAVEDYCGNYYEELNAGLREGREFDEFGPDGERYDYNDLDSTLEAAINKFNLDTPTEFIRGSSAGLLGGANTVDAINAMVGNVVHDPGYTSTSAHVNGGFGGKIIYHIKTPAGTGIGAYVVGISPYGEGENEFLFNKGSAFKVTGAYEGSYGQVHCNLEYVGRV